MKIEKKPAADAPIRSSGSIGADIRALRRSRGWTLSDLAERLERSVGWLSQVERGRRSRRLPISAGGRPVRSSRQLLFSQSPDTAEAAYVAVRGDSRRTMTDEGGLVESLLSPDLGGAFEIVHSVFEAGARCPEPFVGPTEEAHVIEGALTLIIDGERFELRQGDSFRFAGETISWVNEGEVPAVLIWVIAPPVY